MPNPFSSIIKICNQFTSQNSRSKLQNRQKVGFQSNVFVTHVLPNHTWTLWTNLFFYGQIISKIHEWKYILLLQHSSSSCLSFTYLYRAEVMLLSLQLPQQESPVHQAAHTLMMLHGSWSPHTGWQQDSGCCKHAYWLRGFLLQFQNIFYLLHNNICCM